MTIHQSEQLASRMVERNWARLPFSCCTAIGNRKLTMASASSKRGRSDLQHPFRSGLDNDWLASRAIEHRIGHRGPEKPAVSRMPNLTSTTDIVPDVDKGAFERLAIRAKDSTVEMSVRRARLVLANDPASTRISSGDMVQIIASTYEVPFG